MGFVTNQPYYVITEDDYNVLVDLLGGTAYLQDFVPYSDQTGSYYVALQINIDSSEEAAYANVGFPTILFGTAFFTTSTQANISMP